MGCGFMIRRVCVLALDRMARTIASLKRIGRSTTAIPSRVFTKEDQQQRDQDKCPEDNRDGLSGQGHAQEKFDQAHGFTLSTLATA